MYNVYRTIGAHFIQIKYIERVDKSTGVQEKYIKYCKTTKPFMKLTLEPLQSESFRRSGKKNLKITIAVPGNRGCIMYIYITNYNIYV